MIRAGIHTGECELIDGKIGGIAVSSGARVGALAGPAEVLVSQTVKDLVVGSGLTFEDAGEHEHETARLEAFSDGVFAIAITILALDLPVPQLHEITSGNLITAILHQWPSYFAFVLSFTAILILWINHHVRLALVERIDGLLMFGNGLLFMAIVALSYPTALVGKYLTTPAGEAAVATYGLLVLGTSAAWNIFLLALRPERGLLKPGVPPELIVSARRRVALGFVIYVVATGLALVNAYLGLGIITAMWGFWAVQAYRTLNRRERWAADGSSGGDDVDSEE